MGKRINSRAKGCRGEREARDYLIKLGFGTREDTRRGQQFAGGGDSPDVVCKALDGVHLEIKRVEKIDLGTEALADAMAQSRSERRPDQNYAVLWRRAREPWRLTFWGNLPHLPLTVCGDNEVRDALHWLNQHKDQ